MNKVVLVNASPRKDGNTTYLMKCAEESFKRNGLQVVVINLGVKGVRGCIACRSCANTKRCAIDDQVNEIIEELKDAKGFLIGAPVYYGTIRSEALSVLQRVSMVSNVSSKFLKGIVYSSFAVARRGGSSFAVQELMMPLYKSEAVIATSTYWNIAFGGEAGAVANDEEGIGTINKLADNMSSLINKLYS